MSHRGKNSQEHSDKYFSQFKTHWDKYQKELTSKDYKTVTKTIIIDNNFATPKEQDIHIFIEPGDVLRNPQNEGILQNLVVDRTVL